MNSRVFAASLTLPVIRQLSRNSQKKFKQCPSCPVATRGKIMRYVAAGARQNRQRSTASSAELAVQLNEEIHGIATLASFIHDRRIPFQPPGVLLLQLAARARTVASCSRFQISSTHSQCSGFISTDRR